MSRLTTRQARPDTDPSRRHYLRTREEQLAKIKERRDADPEFRERQRQLSRAWYRKHRERVLAIDKARRDEMRQIIDALKSVPCMDCDVQYPPYVMQFDHVRGKKKYNVATLYAQFDLDKLEAEVAKCDVVCANCHAERTYRRRKVTI